MSSLNPQAAIKSFICKRLCRTDIADSDNIFERGLVNSLFALQLINFVEITFSITVADDDLELANFCSIEAVEKFVTKKLNGA